MYLAKHVAGWSLPKIGRFYNGRHHTTVLHAIGKVERLRKTDDAFDALLDVLTPTVASEGRHRPAVSSARSELIDAVAVRVIERLKEPPASQQTTQNAIITELSLQVDPLRQCADHREKFNVKIGFQNHGDFVATGEQQLELIHESARTSAVPLWTRATRRPTRMSTLRSSRPFHQVAGEARPFLAKTAWFGRFRAD